MAKYREVMNICGPVPSEVQAAVNSIDSIVQRLGLGSLGFNVTPATTQGVLTIRQEYEKYVGAEREQGDPLAFWSISFCFCFCFCFARMK